MLIKTSSFVAPLTPTIKKYLAIANRPANNAPSNPPSRPSSSMSTRSALASSRSTSLASEATTSNRAARGGETSSNLTRPHRQQDMTTDGIAGPSRAPGRQEGDSDHQAERPSSRATRLENSTMPPPTMFPSRARRDEAMRVQALVSHPSTHSVSSSAPSRPRAGPMRPVATRQPGTSYLSTHDEGTQAESTRPASRARRVLRSDPVTSNQPSQTHKELGDVADGMNTALFQPVEQQIKPAPSEDSRAPERITASAPNSRAPARPQPTRVKTAVRADGAGKRTSKPVMAEESRPYKAEPRSGAREQRPPSKTAAPSRTDTTVAKQTKVALKHKPSASLRSRPRTESKPASTAGSLLNPNVRRAVSPASIPLPSSPPRPHQPTLHKDSMQTSGGSSSQLGQDRPQTSQDAPRPPSPETPHTLPPEDPPRPHGDESSQLETPNMVSDPVTPQRHLKKAERIQVEQTPISALVESIQKGFMFTPASNPLFTVDEDAYDESSVLYERDTGSVTWNCKPLALSKTS